MMNKSYLMVDEQTVSRLNFPFYQKNQNMPENLLGMQILDLGYANMDFFQNTPHLNKIFGKRPGT